MITQCEKRDPRSWDKWKKSGAIGNINGRDCGEAYAFFDCNSSIVQIAQEIPAIRDAVKTPKRLELYLGEGGVPIFRNTENHKIIRIDGELVKIAFDARDADLKYVLAARSAPNITNSQTADELAAILNQAYQSPLYGDGEQFRGGIVYKERGRYLFRE